jgi:hypothetical protein
VVTLELDLDLVHRGVAGLGRGGLKCQAQLVGPACGRLFQPDGAHQVPGGLAQRLVRTEELGECQPDPGDAGEEQEENRGQTDPPVPFAPECSDHDLGGE